MGNLRIFETIDDLPAESPYKKIDFFIKLDTLQKKDLLAKDALEIATQLVEDGWHGSFKSLLGAAKELANE